MHAVNKSITLWRDVKYISHIRGKVWFIMGSNLVVKSLLLFYLLELGLDYKIVERILNVSPNFLLEKDLIHSGYSIIAGVDEVGRGPLAGLSLP